MLRLVHHLYPLIYTLGLLLYFPVYLARILTRSEGQVPILERAGRLPRRLVELPPKTAFRVWIHAVSVGEANSIRTLVKRLALPPDRLFLSTTTPTGQKVAQGLFAKEATVFYFPLDWRTSCRRYLRAVDPDLVILTETELWPSFIGCVKETGTPLLLINGRFSDRSFERYRRIRFLTTSMLGAFCKLGMQSRADQEKAIQLGGLSDRIHRVGNLKFDYSLPENPGATRAGRQLGRLLGNEKGRLIWVCGSTHEGEEAILLDVFLALRREFDQLRWVVAPRHPHRASAVADLLGNSPLSVLRRSQMDAFSSTEAHVAVLDTIGELAHLYEIADVVFVGGSLTQAGGHNPIEAAHFKKPILFGPHMENFREMAEVFLLSYGALQVNSPQQLQTKMRELLLDGSARRWLGRNARSVVRENQGAVRRTLGLIRHCAPRILPLDP